MSPGVVRTITARRLRVARAQHGDLHPATWAAFGRAIAAWGADKIASIAPHMPELSPAFPLAERNRLIDAANKATARAAGDRPRNRRHRRFISDVARRFA